MRRAAGCCLFFMLAISGQAWAQLENTLTNGGLNCGDYVLFLIQTLNTHVTAPRSSATINRAYANAYLKTAREAQDWLKDIGQNSALFSPEEEQAFSRMAPFRPEFLKQAEAQPMRRALCTPYLELAMRVQVLAPASSRAPSVQHLMARGLSNLLHAMDPHSTLEQRLNFHNYSTITPGKPTKDSLPLHAIQPKGILGVTLAFPEDHAGNTVPLITDISVYSVNKDALQPGDILLGITEDPGSAFFPFDGKSSREIMQSLQGPIDSLARLRVRRGDAQLDIEVRRGPGVSEIMWSTFADQRERIAYLKIPDFHSELLDAEMRYALETEFRNARGLIVDLRGNPGGYVDEAVQLLGQFLRRETVVRYVNSDGRQSKIDRTWGGRSLTNTPMAVLVDHDTASAAELFAGNCQAYGRCIVIGQSTFGKGTVQDLFPYDCGPSFSAHYCNSLKITTSYYALGSGLSPQWVGLRPDIEVPLTAYQRKQDENLARLGAVLFMRDYENALPPPPELSVRFFNHGPRYYLENWLSARWADFPKRIIQAVREEDERIIALRNMAADEKIANLSMRLRTGTYISSDPETRVALELLKRMTPVCGNDYRRCWQR